MTARRAIPPTQTSRSTTRYSKWLWVILGVWAGVVTVPMSYLMGSHLAVLPIASEAIDIHAPEESSKSWKVLHVLSEECACSRDVIDYLLSRGPVSDTSETVLLLDGSERTRLALGEAGFQTTLFDAERLCGLYGSEGVPYFQITSPSKELIYSGGYLENQYSARKSYSDISILSKAQSGLQTKAHPVVGCATSQRLKRTLDPFSLKY